MLSISMDMDMDAYQGWLCLEAGCLGSIEPEVSGEPLCTFMPDNCTAFCLSTYAISKDL